MFSQGPFRSGPSWGVVISSSAGVSGLNKQLVVSALLAFLASASAALLTFLSPKDRTAKDFKAGNLYKCLQDDCRLFRLIDCQQTTSTEELSQKLKNLSARRHSLNAESPPIPGMTFLRARRGIETGEADYKVDQSAGSNAP